MKEISEILKEADSIQEGRDKVYGSSHLHTGKLYKALFPQGVTLETEEEFAMFVTTVNVVSKISRFCKNFGQGGHYDSAIDLVNYAAILAHRMRKNAPTQ